MKKIFVLVMLFAMCGVVLAQNNSANVTQTGNKNNAAVNQVLSNSSKTDIEQTNNGTTFWGWNNEAYVNQTGQSHEATVKQTGASTQQYIFGNYAKVEQGGINQKANVLQEGQNKHTINGVVTDGAYIKQLVSNNLAVVEQRGSRNYANVYQSGDENIAHHKILKDERTSRTKGLISQIGNRNKAYQTFNPDFTGSVGQQYNNTFDVFQSGNDNLATQDINVEWGNGNSAKAHQYGDWNKATQLLSKENMSGNKAEIYQGSLSEDGDFNEAEQTIHGSNNTLKIEQYGDWNYAKQTALTNWNTSNVLQMGNENKTVIMQE